MCDPVTASIALAVTAVASTGFSVMQQAKVAKAQNKAIANQLEVTNEEARQKATGELFDQMRATRREQARIRAAAGEAGLSTSSGNIEALLNDSAMQGELSKDRTLANQESRQRANTAEATQAYSQVNNVSALGAGLQIANAAASGWMGVQNAKVSRG
nr:hypothetical protein [uncultured Sphingomonas sp.]